MNSARSTGPATFVPWGVPSVEAMRAAVSDLPCFPAPASWGTPDRVFPSRTLNATPELGWKDNAHLVYNDVKVAEDARCARLTRVHNRESALAGDNERVVLSTHFDVTRLPQFIVALERWGGCASVGVWMCTETHWETLLEIRRSSRILRERVTFHAVIGHGLYPNSMRTAPLAPFSPWAQGPTPWVIVVDADGIVSVGEDVLADWLQMAVDGGLSRPPQFPPLDASSPTLGLPSYLAWLASA